MKRILLLSVMVGLFAGQASAGLYTMDATTAAQLRAVSFSDVGGGNDITYIGYNPGGLGDRVYGTFNTYGASMLYAVGFRGGLDDTSGDGFASVKIGAKGQAVLSTIKGLGSFDGFFLPISNDNNQKWQYDLYVDTVGPTPAGVHYVTPWATLATGTQTTLALNFGSLVNFSKLTDIGFDVRLNTSLIGGNTSDDIHTSVVPVPPAFLLGFLGLGAAGWKLRRLA
jgi:hypothetical protein